MDEYLCEAPEEVLERQGGCQAVDWHRRENGVYVSRPLQQHFSARKLPARRTQRAHNSTNSGCSYHLEGNPKARGRVGLEKGEEPEADEHDGPAEDVDRAVFARFLDEYTREERERWRKQTGREHLDAGTKRARLEAGLEVYREIDCRCRKHQNDEFWKEFNTHTAMP